MDMSDSDDMDMSGMDMGNGPSLPDIAHQFWIVVGTGIAGATFVHLIEQLQYRQRLAAARRGHAAPCRPQFFPTTMLACLVAVGRELCLISTPSFRLGRLRIPSSPPLGRLVLVAAYFSLILGLCFVGLDITDEWAWENFAYRSGYVAAVQLPLIYLLSGKNNFIGFFVGVSYERLSWLHRWCARALFMTVTLHLFWWFRDWDRYAYIRKQLDGWPTAQRGFAAWCLLLWIVLSSALHVRQRAYEVFVIQHLVSVAGFSAAVYLHLPASLRFWVWIGIAVALFDRVLRCLISIYLNFHPLAFGRRSRNSPIQGRGHTGALASRLWGTKATLEPLTGNLTRLTLPTPSNFCWTPGQHVFLSCHGLVPLQSHPFTVASLPSDGQLQFLVRSCGGATRKFHQHAERTPLLAAVDMERHASQANGSRGRSSSTMCTRTVTLEGPYGRIRPLRQFESVIFLAGGVGGTFTVPLLRDLVQWWRQAGAGLDRRGIDATGNSARGGAEMTHTAYSGLWRRLFTPDGYVTRSINFVWVVKSRAHYAWFESELAQAVADVTELRRCGIDVELQISVYITCDMTFDETPRDQAMCVAQPSQPAKATSTSPGPEASSSTDSIDEKDLEKSAATETVQAVPNSTSKPTRTTCGPNGTCCCTQTVDEDELENGDGIAQSGQECPCNCGDVDASSASSSSIRNSLSSDSSPEDVSLPPSDQKAAGAPTSQQDSIPTSSTVDSDKAISQPASPSDPEKPSTTNQTSTGVDSADASQSELLPSKSQDNAASLISFRTGRPAPRALIRRTLEHALGETAVVVCGPKGLTQEVRRSVVALSDERAVHKGTGALGVWLHAEEFGY